MTEKKSLVFDNIYDNNTWTHGSGPGSIAEFNATLFQYLIETIKKRNIISIVDVGCGDFQLFRKFDFSPCDYLGLDVVSEIIKNNNNRFSTDKVRFRIMPENLDDLPLADIYILKDILIHLDNNFSIYLIDSIMKKSKFIMFVNNTSSDDIEYNCEIEMGGYRPVDVSRHPFGFSVLQTVQYGKSWAYDPKIPNLLARLLRRRVWPGRKHIQLVAGGIVSSS